jgi:hypothetical protein
MGPGNHTEHARFRKALLTFYLVGGAGGSTTASVSIDHLPSSRVRRYPSDTTDAERQVIARQGTRVRPGNLPGIALFIRHKP